LAGGDADAVAAPVDARSRTLLPGACLVDPAYTLAHPVRNRFATPADPPGVAKHRSRFEAKPAPTDFDELIEWFERFSTDLVLLEEYGQGEIRDDVRHFAEAVRGHLRTFAIPSGATLGLPGRLANAEAILRSDHVWFSDSLEQLAWLVRILEGEDHGGHRQALGQYGRVLAEALRRHRAQERAYLAAVQQPGAGPSP
jgi:hypothetical protein